MLPWGRFAAAYILMGVVALVISVMWTDGLPFYHPDPWLSLPSHTSNVYSALIGLSLGGLIVVLTRPLVAHARWAQSLHRELRPLAKGISVTGIVVLAALSSLGEELMFRGLLQPWLGLILQAVLFGLVHQLPGRSRWVWVAWATLMGLLMGVVFELTGSLAGPVLAHAVINGFNLQYLKAHDPEPKRHQLGGLLGQKS